MADIGILELCGIGAAVSAGLGGPIAVGKWCASFVSGKVTESEKNLRVAIDGTTHKVGNALTRLDKLERDRVSDVERIVRLEGNLQNLKEGQTRIEHALEKMDADQAAGRAEIVATIREMSKREIKP